MTLPLLLTAQDCRFAVIVLAAAIGFIDEAWMRVAYFAIDLGAYDTETSEDDFGYTWDNFRELRQFFEEANLHDRAVVFTVDQEGGP